MLYQKNFPLRGRAGWRCIRKWRFSQGETAFAGVQKFLRSHFDSKQKGKALPFCFALWFFISKKIESLLFSNECFYLFARSICGCRPLLSIGEVDNHRSAWLCLFALRSTAKETHFVRKAAMHCWFFVFVKQTFSISWFQSK